MFCCAIWWLSHPNIANNPGAPFLLRFLFWTGRGGATNNHIGNKRFRTIVAGYQREYLVARKKDKALIAGKIVSIVKENGGRFLKRSTESNVWVEVTDKKATEKTSQALREGLDVRHRTIRPEKMTRRNDVGSNAEKSRKRTTIVQGYVADDVSPSLRSQSTMETVPELNEESMFMYLPPPIVTRSDFDNVEQV